MHRAALSFALLAALSFRLEDESGRRHDASEWRGARAVALVFLAIDCPISNGYMPELQRLAEAYRGRGVAFYGVQSDPEKPAAEVRKFAADYGAPFPVLLDARRTLARHVGASITPQVAVLSSAGAVLYLGRIDNRYADIGQRRYETTEFDFRNALDDVLAGRPVAKPRTQAVGCSIPKP